MDGMIYEFENYLLEVGEQRLQKDGEDISLPPKVFKVLKVFLEKPGELVTHEELMDAVWEDTFVEDTNLRYCIHTLRKSFAEDFIETVPKRGYRFNASVKAFTKEEFIKKHISKTTGSEIVDPEIGTLRLPDESTVSPQNAVFGGKRSINRSFVTLAAVCVFAVLIGVISVFWFYPGYLSSRETAGNTTKNWNLKYERITNSGRAFFPGLSKDDQKVAYVRHTADNKYSIVLQHLATKSETVISNPDEFTPTSLQFSPDGNFLYYGAVKNDKTRAIYRIPIFGGDEQLVFKGLYDYFSISPDGDWLAFYYPDKNNKRSHLMICKSNDGSEKRIVSTRIHPKTYWVWGSAPSWSPDGSKIVATVQSPLIENAASEKRDNSAANEFYLVEINVKSGKETVIKSPDWKLPTQAYWIENGNALMVSAQDKRGDPVQIWYLEYPGGKAQNITNDTYNYRQISPAADLSFILAETWANSDNLYSFPKDDPSAIRQLTFETSVRNGVYGLRWTIDGKNLLYVRTNGFGAGNLYILNLDTRESRQLTFDKNSFPNYVDVTPDGRSAVFGSNRTGKWHVWKVDLDGEGLTQLTKGTGEVAPDISPDGKWLYFAILDREPTSLWKQPLEGGKPVEVLKGVGGVAQVAPNGSKNIAAYYFDANEKVEFPHQIILFSEDDPDKLTNLKIPPVHRFTWKPDGKGIYFGDGGESFNNLWLVSTEDRSRSQVTHFTDLKIWNMDISPDGKTFAVSRGDASGKIFKITGFQK